MPEGPSIVILKEAVQSFKGKKVIEATGNSRKLNFNRLQGKKIIDFKTWGKHFLICFPDVTLKIHLMMFGSYRINERKDATPRLSLKFARNMELNFYACTVSLLEQLLDEIYDWSADIMNKKWDSKKAMKKLRASPDTMVCDALLDQHLFAGSGNIIKNEVAFRIKVHPESRIGKLPAAKLRALVKETVIYSFEFLEWKKAFTLKKHWLAYTKKECPRDHTPFQKKYLGRTNRRTFFCIMCQKLYV